MSAGSISTPLAGTGRVADDLYLMAHDDLTGRPLLQSRALGIGLAGGLLAELMLEAGIGLRSDGSLAAGRACPADAAARRVRQLIAGERQPHPVRDWLVFLARTAVGEVAGRLERSGYLARAGRWLPWGLGRLVPVDADCAFSPLLRVRSALDATRPLQAHDAVLAGLAVACGLGFRLDQYVSPAGRSLATALAQLPAGPREVITQTQAAVDSSVLSRRG